MAVPALSSAVDTALRGRTNVSIASLFEEHTLPDVMMCDETVKKSGRGGAAGPSGLGGGRFGRLASQPDARGAETDQSEPEKKKMKLRLTGVADLLALKHRETTKGDHGRGRRRPDLSAAAVAGVLDNLRAQNDPSTMLRGIETLHDALHKKAR